jgi:hypothetical protein
MLIPILVLVAAGTVQTEPQAQPDPHAITCIAPRDRHGRPLEHKICKTFVQWKRYVQHEQALAANRQRHQLDVTFSQTGTPQPGSNSSWYYPLQFRSTR